MASSSPSQSYIFSKHLGAIFKPISDKKSILQLGQIPGYSSVQSSSTFRFRQAHMPVYIFKYKKIEQGQLSYPKIFPSHFSYSNSYQSTKPKDISPKRRLKKLGFCCS